MKLSNDKQGFMYSQKANFASMFLDRDEESDEDCDSLFEMYRNGQKEYWKENGSATSYEGLNENLFSLPTSTLLLAISEPDVI